MEKIAEYTNSTDLKNIAAEWRQQNDIAASNLIIPSTPAQAADYDLPVGLENIGNTCYLNSLLQYLFTVKPVREIAVNYNDYKLELTDEEIEGRLLGGNKMRMKREEAVVAQACECSLFREPLLSESLANHKKLPRSCQSCSASSKPLI